MIITNIVVPNNSFNDLDIGDQYAMGFVLSGSKRINIRKLASLDHSSLDGYNRSIVIWEKTGKYSQEVVLSDFSLVEIETVEYSYFGNHLKCYCKLLNISYERILPRGKSR